MTAPILPTVVNRLRALGSLDGATLERVTVGESVVMVELSNAAAGGDRGGDGETTAGLAHRPPGSVPSTEGLDVETLLGWATAAPGDGDGTYTQASVALGVATLNALSAPVIEWTVGDPMALLDSSVGTIGTVGLFRPAFRKFADVDVHVVERRTIDEVTTPDDVRVTLFRPDEAAAAFADAEVVFVTGSAFVYGGVETYLDAMPSSSTVVLVGATASFLPEPLFEAGVDVVAGAAVTDPPRVRVALHAGACGTDLHDAGVQKVYAVPDPPTTTGLNLSPVSDDFDTSDGSDDFSDSTDSTDLTN